MPDPSVVENRCLQEKPGTADWWLRCGGLDGVFFCSRLPIGCRFCHRRRERRFWLFFFLRPQLIETLQRSGSQLSLRVVLKKYVPRLCRIKRLCHAEGRKLRSGHSRYSGDCLDDFLFGFHLAIEPEGARDENTDEHRQPKCSQCPW